MPAVPGIGVDIETRPQHADALAVAQLHAERTARVPLDLEKGFALDPHAAFGGIFEGRRIFELRSGVEPHLRAVVQHQAELTSVGHFDFQFALGGQGPLLSGLGAQGHFALGTPFEAGRILQHQPHSVVGRHHHLRPLHRHTHLLQLREGVRLGQHPGLTNHQNHGGNDRGRTSGQGRARHPASPHTAANASFHVVEIPAVRIGTIVRRLQPGPDAVQQLFIVLIEIPMRKIGSFHNTG